MLPDIEDMEYFQPMESLVEILMSKTGTNNPLFFRVLVSFYFAKVASMMRTDIATKDRGDIPVSMYALSLAPSGFAKGHSTNIIEEQIINRFKDKFLDTTFPEVAKVNLKKITNRRALKNMDLEYDEVEKAVDKEFNEQGAIPFSFDSGTAPAIKQVRHKMLMAAAGSLNLHIDEIGSNLVSNIEVLNTFLELFDVGKIKNKLIKNTKENARSEELDGRSPTNMLLFGEPTKLLNGGKTEEEFYSMLETGYARRCIYGYVTKKNPSVIEDPEEVYNRLTDPTNDATLAAMSAKLGRLADAINFGKKITISKDVSIKLIAYRLECERLASELPDHASMQQAELSHRYYKALKLAGAYAFISESPSITEELLYSAIKLVEDSGDSFTKILTRDRNYVRLAKYIAAEGTELTQVDLVEDLPFYKGSEAARRDLMALAIAYGYRNNIIIKKTYSDGIEFLKGESMRKTNLKEMIVSYSDDITKGYVAEYAPFSQLHELTQLTGHHYTAHHFHKGYRSSDEAILGFNLVILDIDDGVSLETAKMLLEGYKALYATTKRHTDSHNRFRIIMPLSHTVKLDGKGYSKFMENVFNWLPFTVDAQTKDIARKWETYPGDYEYTEGENLNAMLFIPETKMQEQEAQKVLDHQGLSNMERWFYGKTESGNRSNMFIRYAYMLVDSGYTLEQIRDAILDFNSKLKDSISEDELNSTVLVSTAKAIAKREST